MYNSLQDYVKKAFENRNSMMDSLLMKFMEETKLDSTQITLVEELSSQGFRFYYAKKTYSLEAWICQILPAIVVADTKEKALELLNAELEKDYRLPVALEHLEKLDMFHEGLKLWV